MPTFLENGHLDLAADYYRDALLTYSILFSINLT